MSEICCVCGASKSLKRGWTNGLYCSRQCEESSLLSLFMRMQGRPLPGGRLPYDIEEGLSDRWENNDRWKNNEGGR